MKKGCKAKRPKAATRVKEEVLDKGQEVQDKESFDKPRVGKTPVIKPREYTEAELEEMYSEEKLGPVVSQCPPPEVMAARREAIKEAALQAVKDFYTKLTPIDELNEEERLAAEREAEDFYYGLLSITGARNLKITNYQLRPELDSNGSTKKDKEGNPKYVKIGMHIEDIARNLSVATGGWPKRVGKLLFVPGTLTVCGEELPSYEPVYLETPPELFAWYGKRLRNPIRWEGAADMVNRETFFAHLQASAEAFQSVETVPHFPALPGRYYLHRPLPASDGGYRLFQLLDRFRPATPRDRALLLAAILTVFWGARPGTRPAFMFYAPDSDAKGGRGVGKTTVAKIIGRLAGGFLSYRQGASFDRFMSQLMTPSASAIRVCLIDNLKTTHFSNSDIEALITADVINGHRLYHGNASRPNDITWILTVNKGNLSKDMAQRFIPVCVERPDYTRTWERETVEFIDAYRPQILAGIGGLLTPEGEETDPPSPGTRAGPTGRETYSAPYRTPPNARLSSPTARPSRTATRRRVTLCATCSLTTSSWAGTTPPRPSCSSPARPWQGLSARPPASRMDASPPPATSAHSTSRRCVRARTAASSGGAGSGSASIASPTRSPWSCGPSPKRSSIARTSRRPRPRGTRRRGSRGPV
jgi:hypothetical protein